MSKERRRTRRERRDGSKRTIVSTVGIERFLFGLTFDAEVMREFALPTLLTRPSPTLISLFLLQKDTKEDETDL